ncbi:MAG TPA: methylated-DNA--[protein]-cysteine S-methyltransferase [Mobilitalea sp.]|nr:methylated-DNA--[protein]-cysteine S-methyltransferase [Mobilitalea sp.]
MKQAYIYHTKLGKILIAEDGEGIAEVSVITGQESMENEEYPNDSDRNYEFRETVLIKETAGQLEEYLEGKRKEFTVKLHPQGTEFQKKVWEALRAIPYGETRSYKQIAAAVGNEKACRAVGMANHNNPIVCIIPCHRVIGANGKLVGYACGLSMKEQLLNMEKERK